MDPTGTPKDEERTEEIILSLTDADDQTNSDINDETGMQIFEFFTNSIKPTAIVYQGLSFAHCRLWTKAVCHMDSFSLLLLQLFKKEFLCSSCTVRSNQLTNSLPISNARIYSRG